MNCTSPLKADGDDEGFKTLFLMTRKHGMDIPMHDWNSLNGWG